MRFLASFEICKFGNKFGKFGTHNKFGTHKNLFKNTKALSAFCTKLVGELNHHEVITMTRARQGLIDLNATPYYHVISRCVRRAFLCGEDRYSGKNFDHRRGWLLERVKTLSRVFAIDIAAYAIMSNHYHLVLRVNREVALSWTMDDVIERWYRLYNGCTLVDLYLNGKVKDRSTLNKVEEIAEQWRGRLFDISWFMRNLNETIARAANKEDNCKGRYWEGRYKSQALLDEAALLSCMMYVDLNPVRAGVCDNLRDSDFTSIQERIRQVKPNQPKGENSTIGQPYSLLPFASSQQEHSIPFTLKDYLELADWSGRSLRNDKRGFIKGSEPKLLKILGIEEELWVECVKNFSRHYGNFAGGEFALRACANDHHRHWYKGVG